MWLTREVRNEVKLGLAEEVVLYISHPLTVCLSFLLKKFARNDSRVTREEKEFGLTEKVMFGVYSS